MRIRLGTIAVQDELSSDGRMGGTAMVETFRPAARAESTDARTGTVGTMALEDARTLVLVTGYAPLPLMASGAGRTDATRW